MDYKADLKKLRKYETRLFYEMSECGMSVRGYPLTFDDFPGFKFFIHRNNKGNSYWEVSEIKTGMRITVNLSHTRQEAINNAHEKLMKEGNVRLREVVESIVNKYGELNKRQENERIKIQSLG